MFPWKFFKMNKNGFDPSDPFDEKEFQKMMEKWMSFMAPEKWNSMFDPLMDPSPKKKAADNLNEQVFDTHEHVYIRIPIDSREKIEHIKVRHSLNKCFIYGLKEEKNPYTITLPATVKKKGAKAVYKDRVLEISLPKSYDWQLSEIDVDTAD